jgi:SAM-dependent methyltransferase
LAGKPLAELRVLDLGCLEGQFALEFALHGSQVVAVEGREVNLRKSRFAAEALGVANVELRHDDVRDLDRTAYGRFDVILCLGILYHLDADDAVELIHSLSGLCGRLLIIDSHFSLEPRAAIDAKGHSYHGDFWTEYEAGARQAEEEDAVWSSIGNDRSFLFTRASLCNLLRHAGYTSVYECLNPHEDHSPDWPRTPRSGAWMEWPDRTTFVAMKGAPVALLTSPATNQSAERDHPESPKYLQPIQAAGTGGFGRLRHRARRILSSALRRRR